MEEKKRLYDGTVGITGRKVTADRTADGETVTYTPHGSSGSGLGTNELVYELMLIAGRDMLEAGTALYGGDYTAAELAGKAGYLYMFTENGNPGWEDYRTVRIRTEAFDCSFHAGETFAQIAEWEGVMGLPAQKYYRFRCEGREMPKGTVLKKYTRCHGYRPATVSVAAENDRLSQNFSVLGHLCQALSAEGIRKAMSVPAAARLFEDKGFEVLAMVRTAMRWKLWKDYGNCERLHRREDWLKGEMGRTDRTGRRYKEMEKELQLIRWKYAALSRPIPFGEQDFKDGPECYRQVDGKYVQVLVDHWNGMVAGSPMPEWPKQGDVVMFRNRENMTKKYQGKFLCKGLVASLSAYGDRIEWRASVRVKGSTNEYFAPALLEPAPDDKKPKKAAKKTTGKAKPKASTAAVTRQHTQQAAQPSLEERLRQALLARLAA